MTIPRMLPRLRRVREAEEQQKRSVLSSALQELHRLEAALKRAHERARAGRTIVIASSHSGESADRIAGLEETAAADRLAAALATRIHIAEAHIVVAREAFLAARMQRRQAETLLDLDVARDSAEAKRKGQAALDDWHRLQSKATRSSQPSKTPSYGETS